jgi:excisionase family DNA binding protein
MNNLILSTRNIDDFISDVANEVVKRIVDWNVHVPKDNTTNDKLLTIEEAANFLSLAKSTLYCKVSKGELPYIKRGKRLYFSRVELSNYLQQGKKLTSAEIAEDASFCLAKRKRG